MKKIISLVLVGACVFGLVGCGSKGKTVASVKDLEGAIIGVQLGTTGDMYCTKQFGDEAMERYSKGVDAVQALKQNKVDAVVIDNLPAEAFVAETEGLKILEAAYAEEEYAMVFKKGETELVAQFNTALAELKADGTFEAIQAYYLQGEGERYASPEGMEYTGELTMATNAEFPPYEFKEEGEIVGIDADIARAICDKLGMKLVIEDMAFDSIIAAVNSGKANFGAAGMTVTPERQEEVEFSDSYVTAEQVIIVNE